MDFGEIVDDKNWDHFDKFMQNYNATLENDIKQSIKKRDEYRDYLINDKKLRDYVKIISDEQLFDAHDKLYSGQVCATDGTLNKYPLLTGIRCRIGVVSTSYKNNSIEKVLFISERDFAEKSTTDAQEYFESIGKTSGVSNLLLTGIMSYKERQIALNRPEEWKFIHGTLVPLELRVPRIGNNAFSKSLELAKKIIDYKKCIGVISGSIESDLVGAGIILNHGEYMFVDYVSNRVNRDLDESIGNKEERETLYDLRDKYLAKIKVGIFRIGPKPYLFEAHEDYFDEAAALIIRDSFNQEMRGFPLLIDYADSMCKEMIGPSDFNNMIEHKMATLGGYSGYGFEISERKLRRR